jgi:type II secretory ATPase GspE/PulE/Tfp pilus assembly ATPase PilB-like protein
MKNKNHNNSIYKLLSKEDKIKQEVSDDPIVSIVDSIIHKAINLSASDIHLQPNEKNLNVRYRIDGILHDQKPVSTEQANQILSRIKILSSLDISEKRIPQDGKFRAEVSLKSKKANIEEGNKSLDFRVSTFPSTYGEKMVIRILDRSDNLLQLQSLGLDSQSMDTVNRIIQSQQGFFLATGPTGSGKTTTLYAFLLQLDHSKKNIVTMEDPVEYDLQGIMQSQVNPVAGFTFENGLRSLLRQDPDVIMIGEIRDKPTANIAIESSLTGHLVFSTLHTNDSTSVITRLLEMGIKPFLINAALSGAIAQRLIRKLCQNCKEETVPTDVEKSLMEDYGMDSKKIFKTNGCSECHNIGYKGRTGIFELFVIDDNIRQQINQKLPINEIRQLAVKNGMKSMLQDGIEKVQAGIVSIEELTLSVQ